MEKEIFFEEYVMGSSRQSSGRTITEADVVLHAGQTGDFYPHHMDAEWCRTQPFKQRIAHGTLIFSVGVGMTAGEINPVAMSYGYDRLRFIKPVFLNDTIRAKVTISEKRDDPKRRTHGIVVEALEVTNQRQEVVLVAEHLLLVERRSSAVASGGASSKERRPCPFRFPECSMRGNGKAESGRKSRSRPGVGAG